MVSASPSLLVLNEWFTPAWKVRVNGKKQPVLRINQWQTGVLLPAGKNRVEFEYPPHVVPNLDGIESNHDPIASAFCGARRFSKAPVRYP